MVIEKIIEYEKLAITGAVVEWSLLCIYPITRKGEKVVCLCPLARLTCVTEVPGTGRSHCVRPFCGAPAVRS